eukprot:m.213318 g.213318  ORF g.213318 m.213318 type:complete len:695 (-) comp25557_c0_seq1:106-2190(-)
MASQQQGEPTEADREAIRRLLPFAIGLKGNGASAPQAKPAPDSSQPRGQPQQAAGKSRANGKGKRGKGESGQSVVDKSADAKGQAASSAAPEGGDRQKYTRETMMALRTSPLVKMPLDNNISVLAPNSAVGKSRGRDARADGDGFGRGLQFASGQPASLGRGRGGRVASKGSAALMPFGDAPTGGKPPGLATPRVKLSERVDALRTKAGGQPSPQTVRRMERADPREARGGPRDPSWGKNSTPQQPQQTRDRGQAAQGRRGNNRKEEALPEWATESFDRDDMMTLGGFAGDVDDSNLPDFFKKAPAATSGGGLEDPAPQEAARVVDEDTFFGNSTEVNTDEAATRKSSSKFSRFFAADEEEPTESNIPQAPWSADPPDDSASRERVRPPPTTEAPIVRPSGNQGGPNGAPTAAPSVEDDRASLMRLFGMPGAGAPPPDATSNVVHNGRPPSAHGADQPLSTAGTASVNGAHPAQPDSGSASGRTSRSVEEDRSNLMRFFGGGGQPGLPASTPPQAQHSAAVNSSSVGATRGHQSTNPPEPFYDDGEDDCETILMTPGSLQPAESTTRSNDEFRNTLFAMLGKNEGGSAVPPAQNAPSNPTPPTLSTPTSVPVSGAAKDESRVKVSRAFMPTSVIRKMGKKDGRGRGHARGGRGGARQGDQQRGPAQQAGSPIGETQARSAAQDNILRLFGSGFQ